MQLAPMERRREGSACSNLFEASRGIAVFGRAAPGVSGIVLMRNVEDPPLGDAERASLEAAFDVHVTAESLLARQSQSSLESWSDQHGLTPKQREVVALVSRGMRNEDAARSLRCSPRTVRNHLALVFRKAGVGTRAELAFQVLTHESNRPLAPGNAYFERYLETGRDGSRR